MKKLVSILLAVVLVLSVCTVSAFAEVVSVGDFELDIKGGSNKVTIDWEDFDGASTYRVSINTDVEWYCVDELVNKSHFDWHVDSSVTPEFVFDITVYAYNSDGELLAKSDVVQLYLMMYMCDYIGVYGDVDEDEMVTVMDATIVQATLANNNVFNVMQELMADVDCDGTLTVLDATYIQKACAHEYIFGIRTGESTMVGWVEYEVFFDKWW